MQYVKIIYVLFLFPIIIYFIACDKDKPAQSSSENEPPVVASIPDQTIVEGDTFSCIILDNYVSDLDNVKTEITWTTCGNNDLMVDIIDRIATITIPNNEWVGSESITFRATDPEGLWDENTAVFSVEPALYTPLQLSDWEVSTPAEQGLNPGIVQNLYLNAEQIDHLYSLLIIKNGYLIAEKYFNGMNVYNSNPTASVTKSYLSALTGIALQENILTSLDQKMMEFFPEIDWQNIDPRKSQITIRQILQMRSGYPWEEFSGDIDRLFASSNWIPFIEEFQLSSDPGTQFGYSNFTAHMMSIILERAAGISLFEFANTFLFEPLNAYLRYWPADSLGYYYGSGDMCISPRDMAKFGQLYLNKGLYNGNQIISSDWITQSFQKYSYNTYGRKILTHSGFLDYGYLWWSSRAGLYDYDFAWGHGGQLIVLVDDLNMVIVTTADYLSGQFGNAAWQKEKSVLDLVGEFICSIDK